MKSQILFLRSVVVLMTVCAGAAAQDVKKPDLFSVTSNLVLVDTRVINALTGVAIAGLEVDDFEVYEDGVLQEITHFSQDLLPLSVILLLDVSQSMQDAIVELYKSGFDVLSLLNDDDEVAIIAYGRMAQLMLGFTRNKRLLIEKIGTVNESFIGPRNTFLSEAVYQAAAHMDHSKNAIARRILIAVTDDLAWEFHPGHRRKQALDRLMESMGSLYGLVTNRARSSTSIIGRIRLGTSDRSTLQEFAGPTGGAVLRANAGEIKEKLGGLIYGIRASYCLGYVPSNRKMRGEFRRIQVKLNKAFYSKLSDANIKPKIVARKGYFAGRGALVKAKTQEREVDRKAAVVNVIDGIFEESEQRELFRALLLHKSSKDFYASISPEICQGPRGESLLRLELSYKVNRLRLKRAEERYVGRFKLLAAIFNQTGMVVGAYRRNYQCDFDEMQYREFLRSGFIVTVDTKLPPGSYEIRTALRDLDSGRITTFRKSAYMFVPVK